MPRYQKLVNEPCESSYKKKQQLKEPQQQQQPQQQQPQQQQQQQCPREQQQQQQPQEFNLGYHIYMLREQLGRRSVEYIRLSKAKYNINETLLAKTVPNLKGCSPDELKTVNNQIMFKHKLRHQIQRLRTLQSIGIRNPNPNMPSTEL